MQEYKSIIKGCKVDKFEYNYIILDETKPYNAK